MRTFTQMKRTFLILCVVYVASVRCQDVVEQNNTKTVDLQDPEIDATVKSALENGSVSEVVVRKDLLLFPVNAPNLVIAHRQEIHAVPQLNDTNSTDGKPVAAQVAEVNEYSLSQVVSTNDTDNDNETSIPTGPLAASPFSGDSQNVSQLAPGKILNIPSGFNLSDGLVTEKVALPDAVQNISVPKQSIMDILSKSLQSNTSSDDLVKRSVDSEEENDDSKTTEDTSDSSNSTKIVERSASSEEDETDETDEKDTDSIEEKNSTKQNNSTTTSKSIEKRSTNLKNDEDNSSSSSTTEDYHSEVEKDPNKLVSNTIVNSSNPQNQKSENEDVLSSEIGRDQKQNLKENSNENMDVAEDIVFRPLFRYRQETQLRQQESADRQSRNRRPSYNSYDSDYKTDNSDYD